MTIGQYLNKYHPKNSERLRAIACYHFFQTQMRTDAEKVLEEEEEWEFYPYLTPEEFLELHYPGQRKQWREIWYYETFDGNIIETPEGILAWFGR